MGVARFTNTASRAMYPPQLESGLRGPHLPALDGFRAVAAFLVVGFHFGYTGVPAGLGVLGFFVLSGFLITTLLLKEFDRTATLSLRTFYIRRSLRIFPAFYVYFAFAIGLAVLFGKRVVWPQAISSLLYVNNYYQALMGDPNTSLSHTWSLAIEEQFYLLWPAAFLALARARRLPVALILGIASVWVYRIWLQFGLQANQGYIYEAFDARADHLMIGCLLAVVLWERKAAGFLAYACIRLWTSLFIAAVLVVSVLIENRSGVWYRNTAGFIVNPVCVALLIPQLIAFRENVVWGWLNWSWVRYLGRISYSIYLYQQFVMAPARKLVAGLPQALQFLACAAAVVLAASLSYFFVEKPFLRLKDRFQTRA